MTASRAALEGPALPDPFSHPGTAGLVAAALAEDVGRGDLTTAATVERKLRGKATLQCREACVVAGLPLIDLVYRVLVGTTAEAPDVDLNATDGDRVAAGHTLARIEGSLATILTGERVMLNLVQVLSGVATLTRSYVDAVRGTRAVIVDTRKTIPGMRLLQKYAVRMGGGRNHRFALDDGILIKDNHIAACGSLRAAVERARAAAPHGMRIEVECDRLTQVREALDAGADIVLLDNMTPKQVDEASRHVAGKALIEVSGGVTLETVRAYAESGADLISVGRLTHSARAIDIGLDVEMRAARSSGARRARG
jgi:nicotinate-nucleotide pyrophosphorylase (carboxylating)